MGGGVAGWLTPGWMIMEPRFAPHLHKPDFVDKMIADAEDPKPLVIEECKPLCTFWKDKLTRCERSLEQVIKVNPTKSCLYPMRDYVTCIEACAQPVVQGSLEGSK
jgi:ubiquinol-cytochrome c reductase subunit 6